MKTLKKLLALLVVCAFAALLLAGCSGDDSTSDSTGDTSGSSDSASDSVSDSTSDSASDSSSGENSAEQLNYSEGLDENGNLLGIRALDYVTLVSDYDAISIPKADVEVTEEYLQEQIDGILESYGAPEQITDRAIEDGDRVNIDYSGSMDGEVFQGGTASDQTVTAGSKEFIDDFLTQIIGHNPGDSFDVEVTFPDPYENNPAYAGKDATFAVTVNYIEGDTVVPEFSDAFVKENFSADYGLETMEDMRADLTDRILKTNISNFVWDYLLEKSQFSEIPQAAIDFQNMLLLNDIKSEAAMYGMGYEDYISMAGMGDEATVLQNYAEDIESRAKQMLAMQAVIEDKGLTASDEDLVAYFEENMGTSDYSQYETYYGRPYLNMVILSEKIDQLLNENAKVSE